MKKLIIYNSEIYSFSKNSMQKGGVLTYIKDLAKLGKEMGAVVLMYQYENTNPIEQSIDWNGITIRDVYINAKGRRLRQQGFNKVYEKENCKDAVFIIATDQFDVKTNAKNVVQIQHGIAFDIPEDWIPSSIKTKLIGKIGNKLLRCIKNVKRLDNTPHTVCVDYNYYNWYRTIGSETPCRQMVVIPNYTSDKITEDELNNKIANRGGIKKIAFARRMVDYRGSLMFAKVAKRLLEERKDVDFTFSGDGPCLKQIKEMLIGYENVHYTEYKSEDSVAFHKQFDICVVPTIYSEGTSLSLLEGMAAGCLPISTHVGGLTNILLDGYNGFLTHPDEDSLYKKILLALNLSNEEFNKMTVRAYDSAVEAFYIDRWKKEWSNVINKVLS